MNGWFCQCLFLQLLYEFSECALTTVSGSAFHVLTILLLNVLLLTFKWALRLNNLRL